MLANTANLVTENWVFIIPFSFTLHGQSIRKFLIYISKMYHKSFQSILFIIPFSFHYCSLKASISQPDNYNFLMWKFLSSILASFKYLHIEHLEMCLKNTDITMSLNWLKVFGDFQSVFYDKIINSSMNKKINFWFQNGKVTSWKDVSLILTMKRKKVD